jgi:tRNA-2-methylthio-N6-dimethylallyladenosine synthase
VVPYTRGEEISRPFEQVLAEVRALARGGMREVTLLGQNVNAYAGETQDGTRADLATLIHFVAAVPGIERIRFTTSHPLEFNDSLIEAYANVPKLNNLLHLPVQSGSDRILAAMKRGHTVLEYKQKLRKLRAVRPDISITTDIIVGFPGETEADFVHTLRYVRSGVFANAFTFMYSIRRGTPAARWEQVPHDVVTERFARLVDAQNAATRAYHDRKLGTTVRVLIAGDSKKDAGKLATKATDNVTVVAPKPPGYDEASYASQPWLDVRIESAHVWGCMGTILGRARRFDDAASPVERPVVSLL